MKLIGLAFAVATDLRLHASAHRNAARVSRHLCSMSVDPEWSRIEGLVLKRAAYRAARNFDAADQLKVVLEADGVKLTDDPNGNTRWVFAPVQPAHRASHVASAAPLALELSDLDRATREDVSRLASQVSARCAGAGARPFLLGRSAGDAIFRFALAGHDDCALFESLAAQQAQEFARWRKPQPLTTLQVCERAIVAGLAPSHPFFDAAAAALGDTVVTRGSSGKALTGAAIVRSLAYGHERPLRWLFRRAASMDKVRPPSATESERALSGLRFDAPLCPLIVDLGCGFGTSLLTVLSRTDSLNVLGCDASIQKAAYARGVAARWGRGGNAAFCVADALSVMRWVQSYRGPVAGVCIQFPTPFKVEGSGNAQLPSATGSYMLTKELMLLVAEVVRRADGWVYFASNVEDVAVHARQLAEACALVAVEEEQEANTSVASDQHTRRVLQNSTPAHGGGRRRERLEAAGVELQCAAGAGWRSSNPLDALSETEAMLQFEGRQVFRLLLRHRTSV